MIPLSYNTFLSGKVQLVIQIGFKYYFLYIVFPEFAICHYLIPLSYPHNFFPMFYFGSCHIIMCIQFIICPLNCDVLNGTLFSNSSLMFVIELFRTYFTNLLLLWRANNYCTLTVFQELHDLSHFISLKTLHKWAIMCY